MPIHTLDSAEVAREVELSAILGASAAQVVQNLELSAFLELNMVFLTVLPSFAKFSAFALFFCEISHNFLIVCEFC